MQCLRARARVCTRARLSCSIRAFQLRSVVDAVALGYSYIIQSCFKLQLDALQSVQMKGQTVISTEKMQFEYPIIVSMLIAAWPKTSHSQWKLWFCVDFPLAVHKVVVRDVDRRNVSPEWNINTRCGWIDEYHPNDWWMKLKANNKNRCVCVCDVVRLMGLLVRSCWVCLWVANTPISSNNNTNRVCDETQRWTR